MYFSKLQASDHLENEKSWKEKITAGRLLLLTCMYMNLFSDKPLASVATACIHLFLEVVPSIISRGIGLATSILALRITGPVLGHLICSGPFLHKAALGIMISRIAIDARGKFPGIEIKDFMGVNTLEFVITSLLILPQDMFPLLIHGLSILMHGYQDIDWLDLTTCIPLIILLVTVLGFADDVPNREDRRADLLSLVLSLVSLNISHPVAVVSGLAVWAWMGRDPRVGEVLLSLGMWTDDKAQTINIAILLAQSLVEFSLAGKPSWKTARKNSILVG